MTDSGSLVSPGPELATVLVRRGLRRGQLWWRAWRKGGFHSNWTLVNRPSLTLQGDTYAIRLGERATTTTRGHTVVASVTRAVRTPSRVETDYTRKSGGRVVPASVATPLQDSRSR